MKTSTLRKTTAALRITIGLMMGGSIIWQIADRVANNVFRPHQYFTFFTIDTSLIAGVVFLVGGFYAWNNAADTRLFSVVRLSSATMSVIVAVVYNALLRDLPPAKADIGYEWPVLPNELLHVWGPILMVVEFLLGAGAFVLRYRAAFTTLIFPFVWLAFTVVRGMADGWWPYFFLNPTEPAGVQGMLIYIFGIMAFLWVSAMLLLGAQKLFARLRFLN